MERKKLKAWCISDSHTKHRMLNVPTDVDMLLFAGDAGSYRDPSMNANGVVDTLEWMESMTNIRHKIFVAGNHDTSIERKLVDPKKYPSITWLDHESIVVEGIKIFGSPYTPSFGQGWAYNVNRNKLSEYWKDIPMDTDILITHGPPKSILDMTLNRDGYLEQCGCKSLLNRIKEIGNIRYHVFGHLHQESDCLNAAILKINGMKTTFVNASVLDLGYEICNNGFIIEI